MKSLYVIFLFYPIFFTSIAHAKGTQFELGLAKGSLLKMAIILDQHELKCRKIEGKKWENLVDFIFRSTWMHGNEFIFSGTATAMKLSLEDIKNLPILEYNQLKKDYGGCNSNKYKNYIDNIYKDYQATLEAVMNKSYWELR